MHARMTGVLAMLLALLLTGPPAVAQEPTPTPTPTPIPTPTPTPTPEPTKGERKVLRDYREDGAIEACDHTKRALRRTLKHLPPEADLDNPDLRPALEAAIEQHRDGDCAEPEPTPTPEPTATAAPTSTPAPTTAPTPDQSDDSGAAVPPVSGGGKPPKAKDVKPLPEVTPVPPAETPPPVEPTPVPAEPTGPVVTPEPVYSNADDGVPPSLWVLAVLLGLLALAALAFALAGRFGWAEERLAGPRRALSEARFRAGGTWGDFSDWVRFGR